jgi:hypothetical protein
VKGVDVSDDDDARMNDVHMLLRPMLESLEILFFEARDLACDVSGAAASGRVKSWSC